MLDNAFVCKQRRPSAKAQYVQGLHRTEAHYPNTTIKILKGPAWQLLLSRIGDSLMLYLLMHVSIFLPMSNGCYLQVTGTPATQVSCSVSVSICLQLEGSCQAEGTNMDS